MKRGGYISDHDALIGEKLARILTGGDLNHQTRVSEQYLLDLEREAFLSFVGTQEDSGAAGGYVEDRQAAQELKDRREKSGDRSQENADTEAPRIWQIVEPTLSANTRGRASCNGYQLEVFKT